MNAGSSRTSGAQAWGTSEPSHHLLPGSDDCPAWGPPGSVCCSWDAWTQLGSVSGASWTRAQGPFPPLGAWPDPWPLLPQPGGACPLILLCRQPPSGLASALQTRDFGASSVHRRSGLMSQP